MPTCWKCKAESTHEHIQRVAENKFAMHWEEWEGWRFSGHYMIAPNKAGRITAKRLLGILWEEQQRAKNVRRQEKSAVVILPAREIFGGYA